MTFNKLKLPLIGGNKKQKEELSNWEQLKNKSLLEWQIKEETIVIPCIALMQDNPQRPSQIIKQAQYYLRQMTEKEILDLQTRLDNINATETL